MDEETIAELKKHGVGEKSLAKARAQIREDSIDVEPENEGAVRLFLALQTQWRMQPRTNGKITLLARTGLDYAAIPSVCTALALACDAGLLDALRALEGESLTLHASRNARLLTQT